MNEWCLAVLLVVGGAHQVTADFGDACESVVAETQDFARSQIDADIPMSPALTLAVAYRESRFNRRAVGALGETGQMQIRPEIHCPRNDCNLTRLGVEILARYIERAGSIEGGICRYKGARAGCDAGEARFRLARTIALAHDLVTWGFLS